MTIRVKSKANGGPPASPTSGDAYIVDVATGAWASFTVNNIAQSIGGVWYQYTRSEGLRVWLMDTDKLNVYNGSAWVELAAASLGVSAFTTGSIPFLSSSGTLLQDNANFNYTDSTDTLTVKNITTLSSGTLTATGPTVASSITASGTVTLNASTVTSAITASGTLTANGATVLNGSTTASAVTVSGTATLNGSTVASSLTASGTITTNALVVNSATTHTGSVTNNGSTTMSAVTVNGTLTANAATNLNGATTASAITSTGPLIVNNTKSVFGASATISATTAAVSSTLPQHAMQYPSVATYYETVTSTGAYKLDRDGVTIIEYDSATAVINDSLKISQVTEIGTPFASLSSNAGQIFQYSTDAASTGTANDKGGSIGLGGAWNNQQVTVFAQIIGAKENSTNGDYAGYLAFATRANGGSLGTIRAYINSAGNLITNYDLAAGPGSTSMTSGFLWAPSGAGAPSGVPTGTGITNRVPLYYDTTNNKLYVYNGSWKASAAFT